MSGVGSSRKSGLQGLAFSKMQGIGNDFVVLDCRRQPFQLGREQIRKLADRHFGIGCDQLLSIEPARDPSCAFYYGIWNADGSPSGQCGNGVRCVAAWLGRHGLLEPQVPVRIESPSGPVVVKLLAAGRVAVEMGIPDFDPASLPYLGEASDPDVVLTIDGQPLAIGMVSMGNPHAVVVVRRSLSLTPEVLGPALTAHPLFPKQVNAGFVDAIISPSRIRLRVHERGSGWTLACGTGACAAMAVLRRRGLVEDSVQVELPGGVLQIDWPGPGHTLWMTGPAEFVFSGEWAA
ncbi:diaminopimelate epimerase [Frateuria aurantia]